jgi:hypothetical protein
MWLSRYGLDDVKFLLWHIFQRLGPQRDTLWRASDKVKPCVALHFGVVEWPWPTHRQIAQMLTSEIVY